MPVKEAIQSGSGNTKDFCSPTFVAAGFLQGFQNRFIIEFGYTSWLYKIFNTGRKQICWQMLGLDHIALTLNQCVLNNVLQLPAVAGPQMFIEDRNCPLR